MNRESRYSNKTYPKLTKNKINRLKNPRTQQMTLNILHNNKFKINK